MAKKLTILGGLTVMLVLFYAGCANTIDGLKNDIAGRNPGQPFKFVDTDGDGIIDTAYLVDSVGRVIKDADGNPVEADGARLAVIDWKLSDANQRALASQLDEDIGAELEFWSEALPAGLGLTAIVGFIGRLWGRRKPLTQLVAARQNFNEIVAAVEQWRETQSPEDWARVATGMGKLSKQAREALVAGRAEYAAHKVSEDT